MKNLTAPAAFRFQRKIFNGKEKTACFLKGLSSEDDWRVHLTTSTGENHIFIESDDVVTPETFFDFDKMPEFFTKQIPQGEIVKTIKNITDCLTREALFSEWQAKNTTMLVMGMADKIDIPFQWDTSLYDDDDHEVLELSEYDELDNDGSEESNPGENPEIFPDSEVENFCDLGDMLIINSEDAKEPFWIGRSTKNVRISAKQFEIHWYELTARGKEPLHHAYIIIDLPQKLKSKSKRRKRFASTIDVDTVIMRFPKLDKNNPIPPAIRKEYIRMAKSNNLRYKLNIDDVNTDSLPNANVSQKLAK